MGKLKQSTPPRVSWELVLTLLFYLLALACLIAFFGFRAEYPRLFMYLGAGAVVVRLAYYVKRLVFPK